MDQAEAKGTGASALTASKHDNKVRRRDHGHFWSEKNCAAPHPRREPRYDIPLTADAVAGAFVRCADFNRRELYLNNDPARRVEMLFIAGQVRNERACDYVLRPLTQNEALRNAPDMDAAFELMLKGGLYSLVVQSRDTADQVIFDLIDGSVALFFPGKGQVLTLSAGTEEKRSVSGPENGEKWTQTYSHLKRFEDQAETHNAVYDSYIRYVLVDDDTVTWGQLTHGALSSRFGDYIPFHSVYTDYIYNE